MARRLRSYWIPCLAAGWAAGLLIGCASLLGIEDLPELGDAGTMADARRLDDGGIPPDAGPDATPCPADDHLVLTVNGESVPDPADSTYRLDVLVGDLVTLSAAGSCSTAGAITYEWELDPNPGTVTGALESETITFYPDQVRDYTIELRIRADSGPTDTDIQIRAHGWLPIEATTGGSAVTDIRDLDTSDTDLWIAANGGAYQLPLTGAQDEFIDLGVAAIGDTILGNLAAVYHDQATGFVWFGRNSNMDVVWRLDPSQQPQPVSTAVTFDTPEALDESATIRDIGPGVTATGVAVATSKGLTETTDGDTFIGDIEPNNDENVRSIAIGGGESWAGGRLLYDLDSMSNFTPFGGSETDDNKIVTLTVDAANDELWVGSDDRGIARVNNANGLPRDLYDSDNSGLTTNKIRHLRVEETGRHAGDVWAATDQGVARYIRARNIWITLGDAHGLNGNLDVRAIAIDEAGGRRVIYAGTSSGVVHLRVPQ